MILSCSNPLLFIFSDSLAVELEYLLIVNSNFPKSQMANYWYCAFEDGWLCMRGLHHHVSPLLLWDAHVKTGYGSEVPEYCGRLFEEHGLVCTKT
jgi:hypothetical protein